MGTDCQDTQFATIYRNMQSLSVYLTVTFFILMTKSPQSYSATTLKSESGTECASEVCRGCLQDCNKCSFCPLCERMNSLCEEDPDCMKKGQDVCRRCSSCKAACEDRNNNNSCMKCKTDCPRK